MTKKNNKKKTKNNPQKELLTPSELAEASGLRYSTIKFYSQIGILPFEQAGKRLTRRYKEKEAIRRLEKIARLKNDKRLTIKEIINYFRKAK